LLHNDPDPVPVPDGAEAERLMGIGYSKSTAELATQVIRR
jgi:hypothetical protein